MDLRRIMFILAMVAVCVSASAIDEQTQGCSIEDIDLGLCLNQKNNSISIDGACCKMINKVVQTGFNCLCLLLASYLPLLSTPVSLPLSNCFITLPPFTLCKVLAPMPIVLPPNTPNEEKQPLLTPPPRPPPESSGQLPSNSTQKNNSSTNMGTQTSSSTMSLPREKQTSTSSSSDNPSPKPTCLHHNKNHTSKGTETNRFISLNYLILFLSFAL